MKSGLKKDYKYIRIEGNVIAADTGHAKGVFAIISKLLLSGEMEQGDADLMKEIDAWFETELPFPPQCGNGDPVICFFKTDNADMMMKMIKPQLWLLEKYNVPYYVIYTNNPGEILYEDDFQIVVRAERQIVEGRQAMWFQVKDQQK